MNDVQGAIEVCRAVLQYDTSGGINETLLAEWLPQVQSLARAALAANADDDEPVTEEWLWSVGFAPEPTEDEDYLRIEFTDCTGRVASAFVEFESRIWLGIEQLDYPRDRHSRIASLTTRGSVRRLAAALGIQLKGEQ